MPCLLCCAQLATSTLLSHALLAVGTAWNLNVAVRALQTISTMLDIIWRSLYLVTLAGRTTVQILSFALQATGTAKQPVRSLTKVGEDVFVDAVETASAAASVASDLGQSKPICSCDCLQIAFPFFD